MNKPTIIRQEDIPSGDLLIGVRVPAFWVVRQRHPRFRLACWLIGVLIAMLQDEWFKRGRG